MTVKTYLEQLESVQKAIAAAESNQEYEVEVNGNRRRHKKANLSDLYQREAFLLRMIGRESGRDIYQGVPK